MTWKISIGLHFTMNYGDIEAETREEAEEIARHRAEQDICIAGDKIENFDKSSFGTSIYSAERLGEREDN